MIDRIYTGKGVTVAVLDTGIYPHDDFGNRIIGFVDFISGKTAPYDDNGHGTHVSGILAGDGTDSNGRYAGAAPGCQLISLKVLDQMGNGNKEDILRAFKWLLQNYKKFGIRIVNISVGTIYKSRNEHDTLIKGVERLWDEGLIVVAAAGNRGPNAETITAPGCSKKIITVGSSDMLDGKNPVSGRGPTAECVCKPDLVAPGYRIMSCLPQISSNYISSASRIYNPKHSDRSDRYGEKSGTSMSTPRISGAIALALEKDPALTNVEIKMMLKESCDDMGFPLNVQGWGCFNQKKFLRF